MGIQNLINAGAGLKYINIMRNEYSLFYGINITLGH